MSPPELIAVSGMVGMGKTTLTRALAKHYGCPAFLEPLGAENPWLARCWASAEGRRTNWLPSQLAFVVRQLEDQQLLRKTGGRAVTDQILEATPMVFWEYARSEASVDPEAIDLAERIYQHLTASQAPLTPSLAIMLTGPESMGLSRIKQRARENEGNATPEWWHDLSAHYAVFQATHASSPTLSLDIREYDVNDPDSIARLAARIDAIIQSPKPTPVRPFRQSTLIR